MCDVLDAIIGLEQRGLRLKDAGDLPAALLAVRELEERCEEGLVREGPHDVTALHVATASRRVADTLLRLGRWREALVPAKDALGRTEEEARRRPTDAEALRALELSLDLIGRILGKTGKLEAALGMHERSVRVARGLASLAPGDAGLLHDLFGSLELHAWALEDVGRFEAAFGLFQEMLRIVRALEQAGADDGRALRSGASTQLSLGGLLVRLERLPEAERSLEEAVAGYRRLLSLGPPRAEPGSLGIALWRLAEVEGRRGDVASAVRHASEGLEVARRALAQDPHSSARASQASAVEALLAVLLTRRGETQQAREHAQAALARRPAPPPKKRPVRSRPRRDEGDEA